MVMQENTIEAMQGHIDTLKEENDRLRSKVDEYEELMMSSPLISQILELGSPIHRMTQETVLATRQGSSSNYTSIPGQVIEISLRQFQRADRWLKKPYTIRDIADLLGRSYVDDASKLREWLTDPAIPFRKQAVEKTSLNFEDGSFLLFIRPKGHMRHGPVMGPGRRRSDV